MIDIYSLRVLFLQHLQFTIDVGEKVPTDD